MRGYRRRSEAAAVTAAVVVLGWLVGALNASPGDVDPLYRNCTEHCEKTGQIGDGFFQHCQFLSDNLPDRPWYMQEPLYLRWKQWTCRSDCHYYCMIRVEKEREKHGMAPLKYHGKWPFERVSVMQEPVSAALSAINLILHFNGWLSFFLLLYYKLPLRPQSKRTYYEYTGLWHIYGILAMNAWFWSAILHIQDFELTEKLDCSASAAFLGYSLILSILRIFNIRDEASRVMVAAPLLAFITTHVLYLNFYQLDHGLNNKVCLGLVVVQLIMWAVWAAVTGHPSKRKVWAVSIGSGLAVLLNLYDFPPYKGFIDAHALSNAATIPLTFLWWRFAKDDAVFRTSVLTKKGK